MRPTRGDTSTAVWAVQRGSVLRMQVLAQTRTIGERCTKREEGRTHKPGTLRSRLHWPRRPAWQAKGSAGSAFVWPTRVCAGPGVFLRSLSGLLRPSGNEVTNVQRGNLSKRVGNRFSLLKQRRTKMTGRTTGPRMGTFEPSKSKLSSSEIASIDSRFSGEDYRDGYADLCVQMSVPQI